MLISELLEGHSCKTPGAMFNSKIKGDSVSIKVKLPPQVKIGKISDKAGEKYDDMMHDAMEKIVAKIVKDTDPNSKENWDTARKQDINESVNKTQILNQLHHDFMIRGKIDIDDNGYISIVTGDDNLSEVKIKSQQFNQLPVKFRSVTGNFNISGGILRTLAGSPAFVYGGFDCRNNNLQNLIGGPEEVYGNYLCFRNPLISLDGLPECLDGKIGLPWIPNLPLLKLLFINDLKDITFADHNPNIQSIGDLNHLDIIEGILKKYLRQGRKGTLACAAEMTKAGFKGNAKL